MSRLPPPFNHFSIFFTFPENVIARSVFKGPGACISIYQLHFNIFQLSRKLKRGLPTLFKDQVQVSVFIRVIHPTATAKRRAASELDVDILDWGLFQIFPWHSLFSDPSPIIALSMSTHNLMLNWIVGLVNVLTWIVKIVTWIYQSCCMNFSPFLAKQNEAQVWPKFWIVLVEPAWYSFFSRGTK